MAVDKNIKIYPMAVDKNNGIYPTVLDRFYLWQYFRGY